MANINTNNPIITLTTDFGLSDNYTGILKGIIGGLNGGARIIDNNHQIPKFNISSGCYSLQTSYRYFPKGTIHLAVVDPGVGTKRKALLIETRDYFFIGPDNGIFSFLKSKEIIQINSLSNRKFSLGEISSTFHARDIFAPAAGYLSLGISPDEFGSRLSKMEKLNPVQIRKTKSGITGNILHIDSFGNIVTTFQSNNLLDKPFVVYLGKHKIGSLKKNYGSVKSGRPVAFINSFGYLEIAINSGSAADYFSVDFNSKEKILIATK